MAPSSIDFIRVSDVAELENFSIPKLISYLKTEFRTEAYKKVEKILISREEKLNSEIKRLRSEVRKFSGQEQRYEVLVTRVTQLEKDTSDWRKLASQTSEVDGSNLDIPTESSEKKGLTCETKEDKTQRGTNAEVRDFAAIQSVDRTPDQGIVNGRAEGYSGTSEKKWTECKVKEEKTERRINGGVCDSAGFQSVCSTPGQGRGGGRVEGPPLTPWSKPQTRTKEELERSSTPKSGSPFVTPYKPLSKSKEEQEGSSTPKSGIGKSTPQLVIEINDSDSEKENEAIPKETFPNIVTTKTYPSSENKVNSSSSCEEFPPASKHKRKRFNNIVDSDSDDGSDNEIRVRRSPNNVVMKPCLSQKGVENNSKEDDNRVNKDVLKNEIAKVLSGSRKREAEARWKYEVDMYTSFDSDPLLCMKAVCALYRRRSFENNVDGGSSSKLNDRRFSSSLEERGTKIAKFLLDGNEECEMKKSVEELGKYDPKGLQECSRLAHRYSHQLFTIFKNKEDPFFP